MAKQAVCANINAAGRKRRLISGAVALAISAILAFFVAPAGGGLRFVAEAGLALYGWLGVIQAAEKTCVMLASSGSRETDDGRAPIQDEELVLALKNRARLIWIKAILAAAVTVLVFDFVAKK